MAVSDLHECQDPATRGLQRDGNAPRPRRPSRPTFLPAWRRTSGGGRGTKRLRADTDDPARHRGGDRRGLVPGVPRSHPLGPRGARLDEAIAHIEKYGSLHTEAIVTESYERAQRFLHEVNSSTVLVNASTRFSDGFELGLGAEIGISTTKLHAFGPMGVEELTTTKFIVYGNGQVRT